VGGGQQQNFRSGTLNSPGIVGMAAALRISLNELEESSIREGALRDLLWQLLKESIPELMLNGPIWGSLDQSDSHPIRLPGNLNVCFPLVDGQSLMMAIPHLAVSSGSACTAAHPEPSHVLRGIGRSGDQARGSLRFGVGRFNSEAEIRLAARWITQAYHKLAAFVA
jgi:cysteine desulfurase